MAYAAVVSLSQIIDELLLNDQYGVDYPEPEVKDLHRKVCFLQLYLDKLYPVPTRKRDEVEKLENHIRDVVYGAQDTIELFISSSIRIGGGDGSPNPDGNAVRKLEKIRADLDLIIELAKAVSENLDSVSVESSNLLLESALPPKSSFFKNSTRVVGTENDHQKLKNVLFDSKEKLQVIPITGSPGIGKTTLATSIYADEFTKIHFHIRAWVTVSQDYNIERFFTELLSSINSGIYMGGDSRSQQSNDNFEEQLYRSLYGYRYLIVMDDIWVPSLWDEVRRYLPDNSNGSRIIITSRDERVAEIATSPASHLAMHPLDEENGWILLCQRVFGGGSHPSHLEKIGRQIAGKCQGIPLLIVVVGNLLRLGPETEENWKRIEEDVQGAAASVDESYLKILYLSYNNLPPRLQPCFLYMAAFREDSEILVSKLINLWVAEGFLTQATHLTLEQVAKEHLDDLITRNLISVTKVTFDGQPKSCSLQSNLRQVAMQECQKHSFFHTMKRYTQQLPEGADTQRRISIHDNLLLCSDDFYNCTKSIEAARTLVYDGPNLNHPLPHLLTFELLRVLDALSVYFIELPDALFELIHLRYLAFTYDEDLTDAIGKLHNLLTLIVRQHPKLIFKRISILPAAIWKLPQIRHLLFTESLFPVASDSSHIHGQNTTFFENLQTLSNVNAACCTKEILENMPNLKKLCTWMEGPDDVVQFDIDVLPHLETFKFTVLKPIPGRKIEFQPKLAFPETVRKLSLSGCGLPWEDMEIIAQLPHLQVLKLRELAFQGQVWCPGSYEFRELRFLVFESLDFEKLDADDSHFPVLERLIIRHCYRLKKVNSDIGYIESLEVLELVDCSPSAVKSVEYIKEDQQSGGNTLHVRIHSSWK